MIRYFIIHSSTIINESPDVKSVEGLKKVDFVVAGQECFKNLKFICIFYVVTFPFIVRIKLKTP